MKIYSMTATFGKLSRQTIALEPGLNVIEAPNEWGKSTWCAFLMAMLYGIDTASRSKAGFLADKEHYAPWSGEPMSGSMDICWNGRDITLQRQSKGRVPMGEVKAFETRTGIPVPELSVAAPGQVLLGVERSVFARAGFLRLAEMPVTEDESLRRRLNELVTTGDESGASDDLAQKLRDLKNKCRFNKKGLLPELEAKQAELDQKLQQLQALQNQIVAITKRQQELKTQEEELENHRQALSYQEHRQYAQRLAAAQVNRDAAAQAFSLAEEACREIADPVQIRQAQKDLRQLRENRDALLTQAQLLPPLPQMPAYPDAFRGRDPETAVAEAGEDSRELTQLQKKEPLIFVLGGVCLLLGAILAAFLTMPLLIAAGVLALTGVILLIAGGQKQKRRKTAISRLTEKYRGISGEQWEKAAEAYAAAQRGYNETIAARQQELAQINRLLEENTAAMAECTGGISPVEFEEDCRKKLETYDHLEDRRRLLSQAEDVLQALSGAGKEVLPPERPDHLAYSCQETEQLLLDNAYENQRLQQLLGQCQGQMETLGQEESLLTQCRQVAGRIEELERYYRALNVAQETLQMATQELQRRFAPRISQRAQELFARLTGQRYQRLSLCQDLSLEAGAEGENTLRGTLWRSDGTVDQLYLALRLAVAEELTPEAPLVLDDALVRFDDARLAAALKILQEESEQKQVILFTCQSREQRMRSQKEETV